MSALKDFKIYISELLPEHSKRTLLDLYQLNEKRIEEVLTPEQMANIKQFSSVYVPEDGNSLAHHLFKGFLSRGIAVAADARALPTASWATLSITEAQGAVEGDSINVSLTEGVEHDNKFLVGGSFSDQSDGAAGEVKNTISTDAVAHKRKSSSGSPAPKKPKCSKSNDNQKSIDDKSKGIQVSTVAVQLDGNLIESENQRLQFENQRLLIENQALLKKALNDKEKYNILSTASDDRFPGLLLGHTYLTNGYYLPTDVHDEVVKETQDSSIINSYVINLAKAMIGTDELSKSRIGDRLDGFSIVDKDILIAIMGSGNEWLKKRWLDSENEQFYEDPYTLTSIKRIVESLCIRSNDKTDSKWKKSNAIKAENFYNPK